MKAIGHLLSMGMGMGTRGIGADDGRLESVVQSHVR